MTLLPQSVLLLTLDMLLLILGSIAFFNALWMALLWKEGSSSALQYRLEKRAYLVHLIIAYLFALKIPLFFFFIYTADTLSSVITGAMCAAGVVNAVDFGFYLLVFKLFNLYGFGVWLLFYAKNKEHPLMPYTKITLGLYLLLFIPFVIEIALEARFFSSLNVSKIVSCCGTLFSSASESYASLLFIPDPLVWVGLFYAFALLMLFSFRIRSLVLIFFSNLMYLIFAIISLIVFFSTYVYELPTHRCPFCLLQSDYYGIGYFLYSALFLGTFLAIGGSVVGGFTQQYPTRGFRFAVIFNLLYLFSVSLVPLLYYWRNGVWL